MLSPRLFVAALFCAVFTIPFPVPAAPPEELGQLQGEIREAQESIQLLVEQLQILERRLQDLGERADREMTPESLIGDSWNELAGRTITAVSFGEVFESGQTIAVYDNEHNLTVLRRRGDEWLPPWTLLLDAPAAPRLIVEDLDGDGQSEVLVGTDRIRIFKQVDNAFEVEWRSLEEFHASPAPRVQVADFNSDGRKDFVVLNWQDDQKPEAEQGNTLYVYTRTLSRQMEFGLTDVVTLTDEEGFRASAGLAVANLLGDETPEIVVGNDNGYLWLGEFEHGRVTFDRNWEIPGGGAIGPNLAVGDVQGGDSPELIVGTSGGQLFVYEFSEDLGPQLAGSAGTGQLAYFVSAGNIDGVGKAEIVLTRGLLGFAGMTEQDVVAEIWQVTDTGGLARVWQKETVDVPRGVVQDLNQDGKAELLVFSARGSQAVILEPRWSPPGDLSRLMLSLPGGNDVRPASGRDQPKLPSHLGGGARFPGDPAPPIAPPEIFPRSRNLNPDVVPSPIPEARDEQPDDLPGRVPVAPPPPEAPAYSPPPSRPDDDRIERKNIEGNDLPPGAASAPENDPFGVFRFNIESLYQNGAYQLPDREDLDEMSAQINQQWTRLLSQVDAELEATHHEFRELLNRAREFAK